MSIGHRWQPQNINAKSRALVCSPPKSPSSSLKPATASHLPRTITIEHIYEHLKMLYIGRRAVKGDLKTAQVSTFRVRAPSLGRLRRRDEHDSTGRCSCQFRIQYPRNLEKKAGPVLVSYKDSFLVHEKQILVAGERSPISFDIARS
jgi:hypothetical protein